MSERPIFAEVLAEHGYTTVDLTTPRQYTADGGWNRACGCGEHLCSHADDCGCHDAHLAAVLNAEVDRWLADEGDTGAGGVRLSEEDDDWFRNQCWTCKGSGCNRCEAVRDRVEGILAARLAARDAEWEKARPVLIDSISELAAQRDAAEAEVADLRAKVERVEALADEWARMARDNREAAARHGDIERDWIASDYEVKGSALRAALSGEQ